MERDIMVCVNESWKKNVVAILCKIFWWIHLLFIRWKIPCFCPVQPIENGKSERENAERQKFCPCLCIRVHSRAVQCTYKTHDSLYIWCHKHIYRSSGDSVRDSLNKINKINRIYRKTFYRFHRFYTQRRTHAPLPWPIENYKSSRNYVSTFINFECTNICSIRNFHCYYDYCNWWMSKR